MGSRHSAPRARPGNRRPGRAVSSRPCQAAMSRPRGRSPAKNGVMREGRGRPRYVPTISPRDMTRTLHRKPLCKRFRVSWIQVLCLSRVTLCNLKYFVGLTPVGRMECARIFHFFWNMNFLTHNHTPNVEEFAIPGSGRVRPTRTICRARPFQRFFR